jgi:hypothetical protein
MFSSSVGATKSHDDSQFPQVVSAAIVIFFTTIYTMFKGSLENKFLNIIRSMLPNDIAFYTLIFVVIILLVLLSISAYKFSYNFARRRLPKYTPSIASILAFSLFVLVPYAFGMLKSNYETELITKNDTRIQSVDILTATHEKTLKDVYIVKELEKGLIIREFGVNLTSRESDYVFLHWNDIKRVYYKSIKKTK